MMKYLDLNQELVERFLRDLYMDDDISGVQNVEDGFNYYLFIKTLMKEGGFELHKWNTNCSDLLKKINENESSYYQNTSQVKSENKILGVMWNSDEDNFCLILKKLLKKR